MTTYCPACHQPPKLDRQGRKPVRIKGKVSGYEIVFTEYANLATCLTPGCAMQYVTLDEAVYRRMSESEAKNYLKGKGE